MNPGNFDKRITIQKFDENATNENGFPLPDNDPRKWIDVKMVWAMIKTMKGKEFFQAASIQAENTIRFVIRYTKEEINTKMRVKHKEHYYDIESVTNDDMKNKTLTIIAKEVM
ncbi:phage head closure protein [Chengkuizengella marina]|uniref:Head-tail adaptor protein n=1 Tax=Chengkuizengella marina TaxID=2507566 RepID=A0A6N9Q7A5_9BACL|nr:phage head closure protein [Chengkuizengella marina]NBI30738.1 head-tail adaptor protein [Chengkuizengella marina]